MRHGAGRGNKTVLTTMFRTLVTVIIAIIIALLMLASMADKANAIPIFGTVHHHAIVSLIKQTSTQPQLKIIGYQSVTKRYWSWHGKARKTTLVPIYGYAQASSVPEPDQWGMLLSGLLMVGFAVKRKNRIK